MSYRLTLALLSLILLSFISGYARAETLSPGQTSERLRTQLLQAQLALLEDPAEAQRLVAEATGARRSGCDAAVRDQSRGQHGQRTAGRMDPSDPLASLRPRRRATAYFSASQLYGFRFHVISSCIALPSSTTAAFVFISPGLIQVIETSSVPGFPSLVYLRGSNSRRCSPFHSPR